MFAVSVIQKSHTRNMNWVIQTAESMKNYIKKNSKVMVLRFTDDPPADSSGSTQVSTSGNSNTITFRAQDKEQPSEDKASSSNSNTLIAQAEIHTQPNAANNAGEGSSQEQPQASNIATPIQHGESVVERNGTGQNPDLEVNPDDSVSQTSTTTSSQSSAVKKAKELSIQLELRRLKLRQESENRHRRSELQDKEGEDELQLLELEQRLWQKEADEESLISERSARGKTYDPTLYYTPKGHEEQYQFERPTESHHPNVNCHDDSFSDYMPRKQFDANDPFNNPNPRPNNFATSTPWSAPHQPSQDRFPIGILETIQALVVQQSLPPAEVEKFSGSSDEYPAFRHRFYDQVMTKPLTESQKMSRLLQFVEGRAKDAIIGFEGLGPGKLQKALSMLEEKFGQKYMITNACINKLISNPKINLSNKEEFRKFTHSARKVYETLLSIHSLSYINTPANLKEVVRLLPLHNQRKFVTQARKIRDSRKDEPTFLDLVQFLEQLEREIFDPIYGNITDRITSKSKVTTDYSKPQYKSFNQSRNKDNSQRITTLVTRQEPKIHSASTNSSKTSYTKNIKCPLCDYPHSLSKCYKF